MGVREGPATPRAPGRCPARPAPTRVRGAPLTDGLVAQHGVEEAHLHLRAPHHRLFGRAGGSLSRPLVARRAPAAHLSLPHGRAAQRRAPSGSGRGHGLRAGALVRGARAAGSRSGSFAAPAQAQLSIGLDAPWRSAPRRSAARPRGPADTGRVWGEERKRSRSGRGHGRTALCKPRRT